MESTPGDAFGEDGDLGGEDGDSVVLGVPADGVSKETGIKYPSGFEGGPSGVEAFGECSYGKATSRVLPDGSLDPRVESTNGVPLAIGVKGRAIGDKESVNPRASLVPVRGDAGRFLSGEGWSCSSPCSSGKSWSSRFGVRLTEAKVSHSSGVCNFSNCTSVFVGNISPLLSYKKICAWFSRFGMVVDVFKSQRRSKIDGSCYAFVRFKDEIDATRACDKVDGILLDGFPLVVNIARFARPKIQKQSYVEGISKVADSVLPAAVFKSGTCVLGGVSYAQMLKIGSYSNGLSQFNKNTAHIKSYSLSEYVEDPGHIEAVCSNKLGCGKSALVISGDSDVRCSNRMLSVDELRGCAFSKLIVLSSGVKVSDVGFSHERVLSEEENNQGMGSGDVPGNGKAGESASAGEKMSEVALDNDLGVKVVGEVDNITAVPKCKFVVTQEFINSSIGITTEVLDECRAMGITISARDQRAITKAMTKKHIQAEMDFYAE